MTRQTSLDKFQAALAPFPASAITVSNTTITIQRPPTYPPSPRRVEVDSQVYRVVFDDNWGVTAIFDSAGRCRGVCREWFKLSNSASDEQISRYSSWTPYAPFGNGSSMMSLTRSIQYLGEHTPDVVAKRKAEIADQRDRQAEWVQERTHAQVCAEYASLITRREEHRVFLVEQGLLDEDVQRRVLDRFLGGSFLPPDRPGTTQQEEA